MAVTTPGLSALFEGEGWHYVGGAGEPAFDASVDNISGPAYSNLAFRLREPGVVDVAGVIWRAATGIPIFTLPVGYRPNYQVFAPILATYTSDSAAVLLTISDTGVVACGDTTQVGTIMYIDVSFPLVRPTPVGGSSPSGTPLPPYLTAVLAASTYQPLDADLTAIAALATTSYGRGILIQATAAAARAYLGVSIGTGDLVATNNLSDVANPATSFANIKQDATTTTTGVSELATSAETITGTDTTRTVTPAGAAAAYQPLDSDLTAIAALSTTAFGRGLLDDADAAAARTTIGAVIGTNVQAWDADLDAIAALTTTTYGRGLLTGTGYRALTANTTLTATDVTVGVTNTVTITLPAVAGLTAGHTYNIKNAGIGVVTVDGNASETIDGALTVTLIAAEAVTVVNTGAAWIIV